MGKKETTKTRHRNVRIVDEEAGRISAGNTQDRGLNPPQISPGRMSGFVDAGKSRLERFVTRFLRKGRPKVGLIDSLKAVALSSWVNIFILILPIAWAAHFSNVNNGQNVFTMGIIL